MTVTELSEIWRCRPIANCPGRFVIETGDGTISPETVVGGPVSAREFHVPGARDIVIVVALEDGGLISYKRSDGTHLHTLNTREGFARKLAQLGIRL